jgi:hypothetical protein
MRILYHGTRYLEAILADGNFRLSRSGDRHLSLTTKKRVAKYFAELFRDDVYGFGHIISLDRDQLESDRIPLMSFRCDWAQFNEHEIVSIESIPSIWRYIVRIERVPGSFLGQEEIERRKFGDLDDVRREFVVRQWRARPVKMISSFKRPPGPLMSKERAPS